MKQQKITIKGKIIQIIRHEDWKGHFLFKTDGEIVDVLNVRPIDEYQPKKAIEAFIRGVILLPHNLGRMIRTWVLCDQYYLDTYYETVYFAKRPHNYKVGDYVDIEISISQPKIRTKNGDVS